MLGRCFSNPLQTPIFLFLAEITVTDRQTDGERRWEGLGEAEIRRAGWVAAEMEESTLGTGSLLLIQPKVCQLVL